MGQRTQVIVRYNWKDKNDLDLQKTQVFHNQWGYGNFMLLDVISLLATKFEYKWNESTLTFPKKLRNAFEVTDEFWNEEYRFYKVNGERTLEDLDLRDTKQAAEVFGFSDNNNGGAVVHLNISEYGHVIDGEISIYGGYEDWSKPFTRKLTLNQYMNKYGKEHKCKDLMKAFDSLLKSFDIKFVSDKKEKK